MASTVTCTKWNRPEIHLYNIEEENKFNNLENWDMGMDLSCMSYSSSKTIFLEDLEDTYIVIALNWKTLRT